MGLLAATGTSTQLQARLGNLQATDTAWAPLAWLAETPSVQMALIVGTATALAGWLFDLPRFLAYGAIIVLAPLLAAVTGWPAGTGWAVATGVIAVAALRVLTLFLRARSAERGGPHDG